MSEILWNRYEWQENRNSENISVFDSQKYQDELQSFYMRNQDNPESIQSLKSFVDHQEQDKSDLRESLESPVLKETREELDKQAMINEAKTMLYEKMWISDNLSENNWWENFSKWLVDTLVLDNYDLAIQIWETNWAVIIDSVKELFSSWHNIKKMAEALWESFMWLFSLDWYQTWKSIAELWLITTWVWAWVYLGKKWVKLWMKQIAKLRSNPERIVSSPEIKQVIWETTWKVDEIIPKKELDIQETVKRTIDIERQIKWLEELWIPESYSRDLLESGLLNEKFLWWDLLRRFQALEKKQIDYNARIDEVMKEIPELTREEALSIFSYTDEIIYRDLNNYMRWILNKDLSPDNIKAINNLIEKLESWLEKMPDLEPWEYWYILRWDKWAGWKKEVGEEIDLESFTSVANNKKDAFIWDEFDNDIVISIIWKQWRIKDISSLSIAVNYWVTKLEKETLTDFTGKLQKLPKTTNEWVILPNSKVVVLERAQLEDIYYTRVEQTK